jgi:DNA repair photolyase
MAIIYEPKGRAREYASLAVNHYTGCTHGCRYCYVPTIPPYKYAEEARAAFHACGNPRARVVEQLKAEVKKNPGNGQRVLLSFTTDPYQQANEEYGITRQVIDTLHGGGYNVQVLTKGGLRSLVDRDLFTHRDAYAATMTFLDDKSSREWEPNAALPSERIYALHMFHASKVPTWVSLEPVLDPAAALEIIRETHSFVDLFKIGKLNHHPPESQINWREFGIQAVELCENLNVHYYIKDDLRATFSEVTLGPRHVTAAQIEGVKPTPHPMQTSFF